MVAQSKMIKSVPVSVYHDNRDICVKTKRGLAPQFGNVDIKPKKGFEKEFNNIPEIEIFVKKHTPLIKPTIAKKRGRPSKISKSLELKPTIAKRRGRPLKQNSKNKQINKLKFDRIFKIPIITEDIIPLLKAIENSGEIPTISLIDTPDFKNVDEILSEVPTSIIYAFNYDKNGFEPEVLEPEYHNGNKNVMKFRCLIDRLHDTIMPSHKFHIIYLDSQSVFSKVRETITKLCDMLSPNYNMMYIIISVRDNTSEKPSNGSNYKDIMNKFMMKEFLEINPYHVDKYIDPFERKRCIDMFIKQHPRFASKLKGKRPSHEMRAFCTRCNVEKRNEKKMDNFINFHSF